MMKLFILVVVIILTLLVWSGDGRLRIRRKKQKGIYASDEKVPICQTIYETGLDYNKDKRVPKYTPDSFPSDKPTLFTSIDIDPRNGLFSFKFLDRLKKPIEFNEGEALKDFFQLKNFPPLMNWFDLKECCLKIGDFQGKAIFNEICFSMIYGFITYRYILMVKYVEQAFAEGMRNQDYTLGEVPLTEAERIRRSAIKKKKNFSIHHYESKNPVYIYKGGKKTKVDEDTFEFPSKAYRDKQVRYLAILKEKLAKACSISFIVPTGCTEYVRVCPFLFDAGYTRFNGKAREEEVAKGKDSKTFSINNETDTTYFYSFHCLKDGYYVTCASQEFFRKTVEKSNADPAESKRSLLPPSFTRNSIKIYYFGSVTATSDLDFTVVTFQSSVVRNFHMQRMIIDNYNNRFQSDMTVLQVVHGMEGKCFTTGDCLDTNAYSTGFIESKFKRGEVTGIEDIDEIFQNEKDDNLQKFTDTSFAASAALGMMALVQFDETMKLEGLHDLLYDESGVDFSRGITTEINNFNKYPDFLREMVFNYIEDLVKDGAEKVGLFNSPAPEDKVKIANLILTSLRSFASEIENGIDQVTKISNNIRTDLQMYPVLHKYAISVKKNQAYTLLILDAMGVITQIPPIADEAVKSYKDFILTKGTALMYANEAYFNMGGIKYQTKGASVIYCTTSLEAAYMIMGYDLLHFYDLYPVVTKVNDPLYNLFNHGDSLLKLAKYFERIMDIVMAECKLVQTDASQAFFMKDFVDSGFVRFNKNLNDEVGTGFNLTTPETEPTTKSSKVSKLIQGLMIMDYFASKAMSLKKNYGLDPLKLYGLVIKLEKNVLTKIKKYEFLNKKVSIRALAEIAEFMLTSMTFNFYIVQKIYDYDKTWIRTKMVDGILSSFSPRVFNAIAETGKQEKANQTPKVALAESLERPLNIVRGNSIKKFLSNILFHSPSKVPLYQREIESEPINDSDLMDLKSKRRRRIIRFKAHSH